MAGAVLLGSACYDPPYVPPEGLPELFEAVAAEPALYESAMDGCIQVHNVWKAQVRAVHLTARRSITDRVDMLRDSVYTPYSEFWDGYLGRGFDRWVRRHFDLAGHPAGTNPTRTHFLGVIADVTARAEEITGLRGCAEWYLVYGPGYASMGGLSDGRMLVDFFALGLGDDFNTDDMRRVVSHEVAHVLRGQASQPEAWRHGRDALIDLFRLSARRILDESGYSPQPP